MKEKLKMRKKLKWIVLAGSSNTRKSWSLTEVVVNLVNGHCATLQLPDVLPTPHPATSPHNYPYYSDNRYLLSYNGMKVAVVTCGDTAEAIDGGFKFATENKADVLISASRARSRSSHIGAIDSKVVAGFADVFVLAALDHSRAAMPAVIANRIQQIINMI